MSADWLDTTEQGNADAFPASFWDRHQRELAAGVFWADRIKGYYGDPAERLRIAMENLPVTGAFTEATVAVRALIREQRKKGLSAGPWLHLLYWLAAIASFSIPYSKVLQEPGFNVMETIPGEVIHGLRFTYRELGHKHLSLLNKTDVKWLESAWGAPTSHSTLHELHKDVWEEYETRLHLQRKTEKEQFIQRLAALLSSANA